MRNPFKTIINQYFHVSKKDRNGFLVLIVLILLAILTHIIIDNIELKSEYDYAEYAKLFDELKAEQFKAESTGRSLFPFNPNTIDSVALDSLLIPAQIKRNILNYRKAGGKFSSASQLKKIYGMNDSIFEAIESFVDMPETKYRKSKVEPPAKKIVTGNFDPNSADRETLLAFGFNRFQSNNIVNYRKMGGAFHSKSDLLKIYGVDSSFFSSIEQHIQIVPIEEKMEATVTPVFRVELNSAGKDELMRLNGIGSIFADRIIKYRDLLGGFHSKSQLLEVYNFPPETFKSIEKDITVDSLQLKTIRINFAEYGELLRHPYIGKKQVEAILAYRSGNGAFQNREQLKLISEIDSATFVKIRPYVTCR